MEVEGLSGEGVEDKGVFSAGGCRLRYLEVE
jgi:hypothetical protein